MEDMIRDYVEDLFVETAPTRKAVELKEEMIQNLNDKYSDLISEGKTQEAAYNIAIAGIGDISALLSELESEAISYEPGMFETAVSREKSAMLTSIAVMMYILCALPLIILNMVNFRYANIVGVPTMFLLIATATGVLVYNSMTKPKFNKASDSIVEDFREWQSGRHDRKALRKSISSALWAVTVVCYVLFSSLTGWWHPAWVIFLLAAALEAIINIFFGPKK